MPSFNIDVNGMLTTAASIFNGLGPVFFIIAGVSLGLGLLYKVITELKNAF